MPHSLTSICPDDELIQQMLQGQLPAGYTESLATHIESCSNCLQTLQTLTLSAGSTFSQDDGHACDPNGRANSTSSPAACFVEESGCQRLGLAARAIAERTFSSLRSFSEGKFTEATIAGQTLGRYEILEEIGRGGFGRVLKARDPRLDCDVAIKLLHESRDGNLLLKEARTVAALRHPAIVPVINVSEEGQQDFIVMNFVQGQSLKQLMVLGTLSLTRAVQIMTSVCEGVAHAHAAGVIHRDLKPANILIDQNGKSFVTDFGLALRDSIKLPGWFEVAGTPEYMSPEQAAGDLRLVDARSDIWGLGATLYALLAGQSPFRRESKEATLRAIREDNVSSLSELRSDLPKPIDQIVQKCLQRKRSDRYQSVEELLRELRSAANPDDSKCSLANWLKRRIIPGTSDDLTLTQRAALRTADRRFLPRMITAATMLAVLFVFIIQTQGRRRADDLLLRLQTAKLEAVPEILQSPVVHERWFATAISDVTEPVSSIQEADLFRFRLAELAHSPKNFDDLSELIPTVGRDEFRVLLQVLNNCRDGRDSLLAKVQAAQRIAVRDFEVGSDKLAAEQTNRVPFELELDGLADVRGRYALALATLGQPEELQDQLTNRPDPRVRTWLVDRFDSSPTSEVLLPKLLASSEPTQVSATLLAMSAYKSTPDRRDQVLELFETHPDSGVHSAADWLLRTWGNDAELETAKARLRRERPADGFRWIEHASGICFAILPPGTLIMGSPKSEQERFRMSDGYDREQQRSVTIPKSFAIATKELLRRDLASLGLESDGLDVASQEIVTGPTDLLPVNISRDRAEEYCKAFSDQWKVSASLPTSEEWEYACRAGTTTTRFTGYSVDLLAAYAVFNSPSRLPVGTVRPSSFGLFDMLGNAAEWCSGDFTPLAQGGELNGPGICRGYYFLAKPIYLRSASLFSAGAGAPVGNGRIALRFE